MKSSSVINSPKKERIDRVEVTWIDLISLLDLFLLCFLRPSPTAQLAPLQSLIGCSKVLAHGGTYPKLRSLQYTGDSTYPATCGY